MLFINILDTTTNKTLRETFDSEYFYRKRLMAVRYDNKQGFYLDYSVLIDTKKDLLELCNNMTRTLEHQRVIREVELGQQLGCEKFVFVIAEDKIKSVEDIKNWSNKHTRVKGETLYKILKTFKEHHNCKFMIVPKKEMGKAIIDLLMKGSSL